MLIIDCDLHVNPSKEYPLGPYIPKKLSQAIAQNQHSQPGHGYQNPFGVNRRDIEVSTPEDVTRLHLDRYNLSYAVLQPQPGMSVSLIHCIDVANGMARAWNDWEIETFLRFDRRYLGSICVNLADPLAAAAEIRRVGSHPQMVQVIGPGLTPQLLGHRCFDPVYEACCEMGVAFAIHPGNEGSLGSSTPVGRPSSYFEWHNSLPLTYQAQVGSLAAEGTFEKFPELKVVLVEGGVSWLAPLLWRMDKNFKALRSTVPWLKEPPSATILRHCRLTTQPVEEPSRPEFLLQMYQMIQADKTVCFSTDFPHWDFDDPLHAFPSSMPPAMKERIFYDNAAELYGLPLRSQLQGEAVS
jgi:predicted TIM-barrel fold metal-dependent hydrolase